VSLPPAPSREAERAAAYDRRVRSALPGYDSLHGLAATILSAETGGTGRVLVVGAGTGAECVALAERCPGLALVGLDPDAAMLAVAADKIAARGLESRVRLCPVTVDGLPAAERFDAATLLLVMHFLKDDGAKRDLLAAIAARLSPGAPLLLADLCGDPADPAHIEHRRWWRHLQQVAGFPEDEIERGFRLVERDIHPVTESRLAELLAETGFAPPRPMFRALCFAGWVTRRD
jgi:tRNA (cmo5U34)-methyltransferase